MFVFIFLFIISSCDCKDGYDNESFKHKSLSPHLVVDTYKMGSHVAVLTQIEQVWFAYKFMCFCNLQHTKQLTECSPQTSFLFLGALLCLKKAHNAQDRTCSVKSLIFIFSPHSSRLSRWHHHYSLRFMYVFTFLLFY